MQWDPQAVRAALAAPGEKTSRRLLSELCEDFRREKPEEWKRIEAASYSEPDCAAAQRAYRRASAVSTALLVLALAVVIAAFVLGDFGAAFLTGWGNRYLLAGGAGRHGTARAGRPLCREVPRDLSGDGPAGTGRKEDGKLKPMLLCRQEELHRSMSQNKIWCRVARENARYCMHKKD